MNPTTENTPSTNFQANRPTHPPPERPQRPVGAGGLNQFHHRTIARNSVAMEPFNPLAQGPNVSNAPNAPSTPPQVAPTHPAPPSVPLPPLPVNNSNHHNNIFPSPTLHTPDLDSKVKQLMESAKPEVATILRNIKIDTLLTGSPLKRYINGAKMNVYMRLSRDKKRLELRDIIGESSEFNITQCPITDCIEVHRLLAVEDSQLISNDTTVQNIKKTENVDMALFFSIIHTSPVHGTVIETSSEGGITGTKFIFQANSRTDYSNWVDGLDSLTGAPWRTPQANADTELLCEVYALSQLFSCPAIPPLPPVESMEGMDDVLC